MKLTDEGARQLYWLGVALRVALAVWGTGYIHPDVFFQSGEILARQVTYPELQDRVTSATTEALPWEWQSQGASRSVLPMMVLVALPQYLYRWLGAWHSGVCLLIVERVWMCCLSFLCDRLLWNCVYRSTSSISTANVVRLVWAYSWPTLTLLSMTLSNTLETLLLLLLMLAVLPTPHTTVTHLMVGACAAFGIFTRFTFFAFAAPLGALWISRHRSLRALGIATCSGIAVSIVCIFVDTIWFADPEFQLINLLSPRTWVVAPWNNLIYNSIQENLALHGIHPRITHLAVNFPLLFGGPWTLYCAVAHYVARLRSSQLSSLHKTCIAIIFTGICVLSLAPHQEPRFLLPLLGPLSILLAACVRDRRSKSFLVQFLVISLGCAVFFGVAHQGGVTKALCSRSLVEGNQVNDIIFYKTYPPPLHAFAGRSDVMRVHDAAGSADALMDIVARLKQTQRDVLVAIPASTTLPCALDNSSSLVTTFGPHVSVEALPTQLSHLCLHIYQIQWE